VRIKHVYQPIRNLVTGKIIGHEALLRGPAGEGPEEVFAAAGRWDRVSEVDQMSFEAAIAGAPPGLVFVNLFPATLMTMAAGGRCMAGYSGSRRARDVCIELVEVFGIEDISRLKDSVEAVRAAGLMVAVDDVSDGCVDGAGGGGTTVSVVLPISSGTFMFKRAPTSSTMPSFTYFWKPWCSVVSR